MLKPTPKRIKLALQNPGLIRAWLSKLVDQGLYLPYASFALSFLSRWPIGTNIYTREWDLIIILDTCRVDAIKSVQSEYDFIQNIDTITSVGSKTSEWVAQTFVEEYTNEISNTTYISANPWTAKILNQEASPEDHSNIPFAWTNWRTIDSSVFQHIEPAWQYTPSGKYGHEDGPTPAEYITDRTVELGRSTETDRIIAHYIQPHAPYTRQAYNENRSLNSKEINFDLYLRQGNDKKEVWDLYLDELRYVLDSVSILLNNIDAEKVVITADHGEGFGEWGGYEHPAAAPHPKIRKVPWIETTASDSGSYSPIMDKKDHSPSDSVKERLETLGYRS